MSVVFYASKPPATVHPRSWAPLEHMHDDDEYVYPLNTVRKSFPIPRLRFLHAVPGEKPLRFEMFLRNIPCVVLVDSGATHSFVSRRFCHKHALHYSHVSSSALLADGVTCLSVVGVLWNPVLQVASFSCKQSLLVLESSSSDVVLGMDQIKLHQTAHDILRPWR
jgi:hypothetical protein